MFWLIQVLYVFMLVTLFIQYSISCNHNSMTKTRCLERSRRPIFKNNSKMSTQICQLELKDIWRPCLSTDRGFRCGDVMRFRSRYTLSTNPWCRVNLFISSPDFCHTKNKQNPYIWTRFRPVNTPAQREKRRKQFWQYLFKILISNNMIWYNV